VDVATRITVEQVQAAVRRYFAVMSAKAPGELEKMYTYDSVVFNPFTPRGEPGRVSATRQEREYFKPQSSYRAEITGPIEVQILADNVAVAAHTMRSFGTNLEEPTLGKRFNRAVRDGRGTHVFILDSEDRLLIAHQHISDICRAPLEPVK
jgi:ketosteroid isomerase-like protein